MLFATIPLESASSATAPPPAFLGWFFFLIGGAFMLAFGAFAALKIATGFWIRKRQRRTASLVAAGIACLSVPFGTMVGVLTFLVLLRPSVKALYESEPAPGNPPVEASDDPAVD